MALGTLKKTSAQGNGTACTVNAPSPAFVAGNYVVAILQTSLAGAATVTPPNGGWSLIQSNSISSQSNRMFVYSKQFDSTDAGASTYTFTTSGSTSWLLLLCTYTSAIGIDGSAITSNGSTTATSWPAASVTTTVINTGVVTAWGANTTAATTLTLPTGHTSQYDNVNGATTPVRRMVVTSREQSAAGATGNPAITSSSAVHHNTSTVVFKPALDAPVNPPTYHSSVGFIGMGEASIAEVVVEESGASSAGNPNKPDATSTIQSMVNAASAGSTITVPGNRVYRERVSVNKALTIVGEEGAEIRGSQKYTTWEQRSDGRWRSLTSVPAITANSRWTGTDGANNAPQATMPEQVFVNGTYYAQIATSADNPGNNQFCIDTNRKVILNENPAGKVVEVTQRSGWITCSVPGVTIQNIQMRHAADIGVMNNGNGNTKLVGCKMDYAHFQCIAMGGSNVTGLLIDGCKVGYGGQLCVTSNDATFVIRNSEFHHGNWQNHFDTGWEAGAVKISNSNKFTFEDNIVRDIVGFGLWFDMVQEPQDFQIRRSKFHHITHQGIRIEISQNWLIDNCAFWENGWFVTGDANGRTGLTASTSFDGNIQNCVFAWNKTGLSVIAGHRSHSVDAGIPNPERWNSVDEVYVSNNTFVQDNGTRAIVWHWGGSSDRDPDMYTANANHNINNRYYWPVAENTNHRFYWSGAYTTLQQAKNNSMDSGGAYITVDQARSALIAKGIPTTSEHGSLPSGGGGGAAAATFDSTTTNFDDTLVTFDT